MEFMLQFLSVPVAARTLPLCLSSEQTILEILVALAIMTMSYVNVIARQVQQRMQLAIWLLIMVIDCISFWTPVNGILKELRFICEC